MTEAGGRVYLYNYGIRSVAAKARHKVVNGNNWENHMEDRGHYTSNNNVDESYI